MAWGVSKQKNKGKWIDDLQKGFFAAELIPFR